MFDFESRRIIEALRSGVPSKSVGQYFSEARPQIMRQISEQLAAVCNGKSGGMVITGKYGEGKTHLLNTVFTMAQDSNMVVSLLPLGKETPMDKLPILYQKIVANTYLPGRKQPGFINVLENMTAGSQVVSDLLLYCTRELETDKLYYLLKAYMETEDSDEKFLLKSDLEGDFVANAALKKIYKRIFGQTVKFNVNFTKTKHTMDYFCFLSHLFQSLGYNGWVILFDEAELIGRFGKRARQNSYRAMYPFLFPQKSVRALEHTYSVFAFSASYLEDVIEGKHEYANLEELYQDDQEPGRQVMNAISKAPQLVPLTKEEISQVIVRIIEFYQKAYAWGASLPVEKIVDSGKNGGYLLRTRIRSVIETLDQLYQYGEVGNIHIGEIKKEEISLITEWEEDHE